MLVCYAGNMDGLKKLLLLVFPFIMFFVIASPVFAGNPNLLRSNNCTFEGAGAKDKVVTIDCVPVLFVNIIYWLLVFSATVALFFIIFGGIKLLTSGGDPKGVEGARKTITWAVVGLVVIFLSFMIVNMVADLTGIKCSYNLNGTRFSWCTSNT